MSEIKMTRVVLRKNIVDGVNMLTQEMVSRPNTIYIVQYDYFLAHDVGFPKNCVLRFEGGSVANLPGNHWYLIGNHTPINSDVAYNIFNDTLWGGFDLPYIDIRWVGGVSDYNEMTNTGTDNAAAFETALTCLGRFYRGLYIKVVGQYYIGSPVTTPYDLNLQGSHFNSRNVLEYGTPPEVPSSPSMIAIGDTYAFNLAGRGDGTKFCNFNIKNIKVLGTQSKAGVFINYSAVGAPSRVSVIEECEFTNLNICFQSMTSGDTALDGCIIQKCQAYNNNKFVNILSLSDESTVGNLVIRDSCIEENGEACIEIKNAFGSVVIDNNRLDNQRNVIDISLKSGSVDIARNHFYGNLGDYLIHVKGTHQKTSHLRFHGNYISESTNKYILEDSLTIDEFDQFNNIGSGSHIDSCYINCDCSALNLDMLDTCALYINPNAIGAMKPFKILDSTGVVNEVLYNKYLVNNNVGWRGLYVRGGNTYYNFSFTCFSGTGEFRIGFYNNSDGNSLTIYPSNEFPLVIARLKPYQDNNSDLMFGQPDGGTVKCTEPILINSINEAACPTIYTKCIGDKRPVISVGALPVGFEYFDNGKPNYWNGNTWVDAAGNIVPITN